MSPIQTNTQQGVIVRVANMDLSKKEGYLATIVSAATGTGLPGGVSIGTATTTYVGDVTLAVVGYLPLYVITEGGDGTGYPVSLQPLSPDRNVRVILGDATINAGVLVSSDANGKARAAVAGDIVFGVTEEYGTVGQYVLIRPCSPAIFVTSQNGASNHANTLLTT